MEYTVYANAGFCSLIASRNVACEPCSNDISIARPIRSRQTETAVWEEGVLVLEQILGYACRLVDQHELRGVHRGGL